MAESTISFGFARSDATALTEIPSVVDSPVGITINNIGSSGSPNSTAGTVVTFKASNTRAFQIFIARNSNDLFYRVSNGSTSGTPVWIAWRKLTGTAES